eukprot:gene1344-32706_t
MPSDTSRMVLIQATRHWRTGPNLIRTFISTGALEDEVKELNVKYGELYGETYMHVDDEQHAEGTRPHSKRPGDLRAALSPFLAHEHYGDTYKWMLYGDDDTIFFPSGVFRLINELDQNVPMALTDNIWRNHVHPSASAPRCLPCSLDGGPDNSNISGQELYNPVCGCPTCSLDKACAYHIERGRPSSCAINSGAHGGAGIIFSSAFFTTITADMARECFNTQYGHSGGDAMLSKCLLLNNISYTEPGYTWRYGTYGSGIQDKNRHSPSSAASEGDESIAWSGQYSFPQLVVFDNNHNKRRTRNYIYRRTRNYNPEAPGMSFLDILQAPAERLLRGKCNVHCKWLIRHAVSYHVGARFQPSLNHAAAVMQLISGSHRLALEFLSMMTSVQRSSSQGTGFVSRRPALPAKFESCCCGDATDIWVTQAGLGVSEHDDIRTEKLKPRHWVTRSVDQPACRVVSRRRALPAKFESCCCGDATDIWVTQAGLGVSEHDDIRTEKLKPRQWMTRPNCMQCRIM